MKKQYVAPMADKVDFDYEENVVASGTPKQHDCSGKSYGWSWSWSDSGRSGRSTGCSGKDRTEKFIR